MATLYVGGRLFDGEKVQDGQAVLEEGGRIKRVAPAGEFKGFAGETVDTSGATLIPGMIDCHVHSLSGAEGNVSVSLTAVAKTYAIRVEGTHASAASGSPTTIKYGGTATLSFDYERGYFAPTTVTVENADGSSSYVKRYSIVKYPDNYKEKYNVG